MGGERRADGRRRSRWVGVGTRCRSNLCASPPEHQVHDGFGLSGDSPLNSAHLHSRMKSRPPSAAFGAVIGGFVSLAFARRVYLFGSISNVQSFMGARERTPRTEVLAPPTQSCCSN